MKRTSTLLIVTLLITTVALAQTVKKMFTDKQMPNIEVSTLEGQKVKILDAIGTGKITVINFWATWCGPCKLELNNIAELYPDWKKDYNVQLIAISIDDSRNTAKVKTYVGGRSWDYTILLDSNQDLNLLRAKIGMVFQKPNPFPKSIYDNVAYGPRTLGEKNRAKLDEVVKQGAILASNTSYLNVDEIATATKRPGYVLGLHFFSPANVMKLLEIVRGRETRHDVLATCMKLAKTIGKVAVVAGVCDGFIGNRMLSPRQRQANALIMEGANYWDVDDVLLEYGFPMGPFQMSDLAGVDIGWHRDPNRIETLRDALCAAGRWGQKVGKGFYDYDEARNRTPSDETRKIIADFAAKEGKPQREISKDEIRERLLYPMVDEGAKILDEKMAQRASDIDVVWINGYGWPLYTGGPMFWADTIGLKTVVEGLEKHGLPVSDYLRRKADAGERFNA